VIGFSFGPGMNGNSYYLLKLSKESKAFILFLLRLFFPGGITLITLALLLFTLTFVFELSGNHEQVKI